MLENAVHYKKACISVSKFYSKDPEMCKSKAFYTYSVLYGHERNVNALGYINLPKVFCFVNCLKLLCFIFLRKLLLIRHV